LSLICGSLTWLRDERLKQFEGLGGAVDEAEPDWIREHLRKERITAAKEKRDALELKLSKIRAKESRQKQRYAGGEPLRKKTKLDATAPLSDGEDAESRFLLADYNSEDDSGGSKGGKVIPSDGLSAKSFDLLSRLGMIVKPDSEEDDLQVEDGPKIFYCSRTHSQLTQFANEVRRVKLPAMQAEVGLLTIKDEESSQLAEEVKYLSLGARKNLCINPKVSRLGSAAAINDRCLELQQPGTSQDNKCQYLPNKENETLVNTFRDYTLAKIRDIEELPMLGKEIGICPYYASRSSIKPSEVVTLPYPLLLQKSAREALDISLKGHVVIIDEAHNLMDAISSLYSVSVRLSQLERSRAQLGVYLQKFRNKLKGKNRVYVTQVVRLIDSLIVYLRGKAEETKSRDGRASVNELMAGKGVDQINIYKLGRYLQESKLARKVDGYNAHILQEENSQGPKRASGLPVLSHIQSFFQTLMNPAADGRYFYSKDESDISLKYMLLDPSYSFREVVEEARAVILAGGTMSPIEDYTRHLLSYLDSSRIKTVSCGHVIPDENLLACPVTRGPSGIEFDFTYEKRNTSAMIDELGSCILALAQAIPDGLVVFFPSYAYLDQVSSRWKTTVQGKKAIWDSILLRKPIFLESKESTNAESVLDLYSAAILAGKGGLLLSVIGGKMSEGINFSDALGRGVVVVGLPFPNIQSAEWKAKLEYIEQATVLRGGSSADGKAAAREFYENACMRAINQSIGRAIRHKGDYATIVMLDRRYNTSRIQEKLPGWIRKGLKRDAGGKAFTEVIAGIEEFFEGKIG
jgi:chromosome transmission fidelity protein 1